jgi:hypothetical protein
VLQREYCWCIRNMPDSLKHYHKYATKKATKTQRYPHNVPACIPLDLSTSCWNERNVGIRALLASCSAHIRAHTHRSVSGRPPGSTDTTHTTAHTTLDDQSSSHHTTLESYALSRIVRSFDQARPPASSASPAQESSAQTSQLMRTKHATG